MNGVGRNLLLNELILEETDFPNVLCTYLERVGLRFFLLRPSEWPCDFCSVLIIQSWCRDHFKDWGWLIKCQTGQNTWQTSKIESKGSPISQNISKKLIILSNAQRAHPRGAAGRSKFHLKENGHTQEMAPQVQLLPVRPTGREGTGCLWCGPGYFCWLHFSWLLLLPRTSGSAFENQFKLLLSSLLSRVVMRNWWENGCDSTAFAMIRSNKT